jgi:hypothetical protein
VLVQTNGAKQMKVSIASRRNKIRLSAGARLTNLTSQGLLKILRRTDSAIRDDGRWYVDPLIIDQITTAQRVLGVARTKRSKRKEKTAIRRTKSGPLASNQQDDSLRAIPGSEFPE